MSPSNQPVLSYFDIPGRAELTRLVLTYGKIAFDDKRYSFDAYFGQKSNLDLPFGQFPTMKIDGKSYGQSMAIARYAAKLAGLYPEDALAALETDAVVDTILEVFNAVIDVVYFEKDQATRDAKWLKLNQEIMPAKLSAIEKRVAGPYVTGATVTYADLYLLDLVENIFLANAAHIQFNATDYPKLEAILQALRQSPQLESYLSK